MRPRPSHLPAGTRRFDGGAGGAGAVYFHAPHEWTDEQFRLAEWPASQCAHVLEVLRMQAELRETDRRKSEFLATLSHELRNPLASIRFAVELLGKDGDARGADPRPVIERQLRHLVRLVDDLLETTRISSNKVEACPVTGVQRGSGATDEDGPRHEGLEVPLRGEQTFPIR